MPIGGLKEKTMAAHRAGIKTVMFPVENKKDLEDIPDSVSSNISLLSVNHMDEVLINSLEWCKNKDNKVNDSLYTKLSNSFKKDKIKKEIELH